MSDERIESKWKNEIPSQPGPLKRAVRAAALRGFTPEEVAKWKAMKKAEAISRAFHYDRATKEGEAA